MHPSLRHRRGLAISQANDDPHTVAAFVHETAVVDDDVEMGEGTRVWHFVHISAGARIGKDCTLGQNVFIGEGVPIGAGVRIQNNVSVYAGVEVADDVFLGPSCVFTNVDNPRAFVERKQEYRPTRVGRGASVGANATIVCGHDLGEYCFVGAGAVVPRAVAAYALCVGNPARQIGWMCRCGVRLDGLARPATPAAATPPVDAHCEACGSSYRIEGGECTPTEPG